LPAVSIHLSKSTFLLKKYSLPALLLFLFTACNTIYTPTSVEYRDYRITAEQPKDSALLKLIQPYSDSVNSSMNEVVGYAETTLEKKQPDGSLNHFMADAMLYAGKQHFKIPIDAAFVNYGGVRITQLPKGAITRGKIFELMPFDNLVVVQQVTGEVLQQFLDFIATKGGWPVAGIVMQIKDKKAVNIIINGQPLEMSKTYHIINSDYVANGGDNADMLKPIAQQNIGYLMRDALFDYIKALKAEGIKITAKEENRITYAQ
jgi:2',3'-cyclic-nucleotide 2'-phosphodiesterase (5'-nucleotidase family)